MTSFYICRSPVGAGTMSYPGVCDLELSEDVLGHVVFSHGIHHKVLIPGGALCRPVLVTLFLFEQRIRD